MLIERKADVAAKNAAGDTPLHVACNNGQTSTAQLLLNKDADPNDANKAGNTPLHSAARTGFGNAVKALIAAGAKPTSNRAGKTPQAVALDADIAKLIEAAA
jgi:cytohesin